MSLSIELSRFIIALSISWFVTRLPLFLLPRITLHDLPLVDHPAPLPIDEALILQLLRVRRAYWASIPIGLVPIVLGLLMIVQSPSSFGFGLIVGAAWVLIARITPFSLEPTGRYPYSMALIHELNRLRLEPVSCCTNPSPSWELDGVRCISCHALLLAESRPDLGRRRSDNILAALLRVILLDGRPFVDAAEEE
ncbi:MAG TPA: hypothetical protein HA345_05500 [Candidatus Thalassarchaeaceae archaeon]|nr:MAG TPA: hypothetical protein D7H94_05490 [Candidatus Poseidoniales archaeon]HIH84845.1 hypothetical protein [Candidatus Thalassarchaeaceae archaeon]